MDIEDVGAIKVVQRRTLNQYIFYCIIFWAQFMEEFVQSSFLIRIIR